MLGERLPLALRAMDAWGDGPVAVLHPPEDADLAALPRDGVHVVSPLVTTCARFARMGHSVSAEMPAEGRFAASVVCLARARAEARALVAAAAARTDGPVIVDGQKTDGADSMLRALRRVAEVSAPICKAHGKIYAFAGGADLPGWARGPAPGPGGFWTAPGVFSADGADPASALLAEALPGRMDGSVADLGAGWGYLSARVLARGAREVHLVEAHDAALRCARRNVADPRARFHWADATTWTPRERVDAVVTNPPLHGPRGADPAIGRAFVAAAARVLRPGGALWMVANRHLPYEEALASHFARVADLGGDARFKLARAERPRRPGR